MDVAFVMNQNIVALAEDGPAIEIVHDGFGVVFGFQFIDVDCGWVYSKDKAVLFVIGFIVIEAFFFPLARGEGSKDLIIVRVDE